MNKEARNDYGEVEEVAYSSYVNSGPATWLPDRC